MQKTAISKVKVTELALSRSNFTSSICHIKKTHRAVSKSLSTSSLIGPSNLIRATIYSPASGASREVANLTEGKNPHTPIFLQIMSDNSCFPTNEEYY